MDAKGIFEKLGAKFGDAVSAYTEGGDPKTGAARDGGCKVKTDKLVEVMTWLKDDPGMHMDFLQCVTAVDWIKKGVVEVVYHLYSYEHRHSFVMRVEAPRDACVVPSVVKLWPTADWQEREQFDLLGVLFEGHPDLRRLLMPDDWEGYPMRKDYKEAADYRGMPTTRYSPLELLVAYDKANPQVEGQRPTPPPPKVPAK